MDATIVQSVMNDRPVTLNPETTVRVAATRMKANEIGSVLVVDDGDLAGIVTERDLTRLLAEGGDPDETRVADAMTSPVVEIEPAKNVETAIETMIEHGVRHLAVVLEGELRGIVTVTDIAHAEPELARRASANLSGGWQD